jgi:hypothetical protein
MTKYYYSPSTKGFYLDSLHKQMPKDILEITEEKYKSLLAETSTGKELYLVNNVPTTRTIVVTVTWDDIRSSRDSLLSACDWTQLPDADLTDAQKTAWTKYRQELRDMTDTYKTPDTVVWPTAPQ